MADLWNLMKVLGSRVGGAAFEPARDIPSLKGKVVVITGAAGDLGRETATQLARHGRPERIYAADLPRRDEAARAALVHRITQDAYDKDEADGGLSLTDVGFLGLDLGSFESIRRCAADVIAREQRLDLLILNAGIIRTAKGATEEGYECHFGINYVGHALLVKLLMPLLLRTAGTHSDRPRIVVVASEGWVMAPKTGILFDQVKTDGKDMPYTQRYGQSKLALIHLTRQLAQLYPQVDVAALHPGRVLTGMGQQLGTESLLVRLAAPLASVLALSPIEGAKNHLWTATSPSVVSGKYYEPIGVPGKEGKLARDPQLTHELWDWTEREFKDLRPI